MPSATARDAGVPQAERFVLFSGAIPTDRWESLSDRSEKLPLCHKYLDTYTMQAYNIVTEMSHTVRMAYLTRVIRGVIIFKKDATGNGQAFWIS